MDLIVKSIIGSEFLTGKVFGRNGHGPKFVWVEITSVRSILLLSFVLFRVFRPGDNV